MTFKLFTIFFLFSIFIAFFSLHLQPCLSQTENAAGRPSSFSDDPLFDGSGWFDVFIQPYNNEGKPASSSLPTSVSGKNLSGKEEVKNEDAQAPPSITPPIQKESVAEEAKKEDEATMDKTSLNVPASGNERATATDAVVEKWDAWIDYAISKQPHFGAYSPFTLRSLVGIILHALKENSASYMEFSQFWNMKKEDFRPASFNDTVSALIESGAFLSVDYVGEETVDNIDNNLIDFLKLIGVIYWTKKESYEEFEYDSKAPITMMVRDATRIAWPPKYGFSINEDKILPFYPAEKGSQVDIPYIVGSGKIPTYKSDSFKAMALDIAWRKENEEGKQYAADNVVAYFIKSKTGKWSTTLFDEVRNSLNEAPVQDVKVSFPAFLVYARKTWGKASFPKFLGSFNKRDSDILGAIHGGALNHHDEVCIDANGGHTFSFSYLELFNDGTEIQESPPSASSGLQTDSIQLEGDMNFNQAFHFVLYDKKANLILQIAQITDPSQVGKSCRQV